MAEPIEIQVRSHSPRVMESKAKRFDANAPSPRRNRRMPSAARISTQNSVPQLNPVNQPVQITSEALNTAAQLPSTPDSPFLGASEPGLHSQSIGELPGVPAESPQSFTMDIKRGMSQKQEAPADTSAAQPIDRDAQIGSALQAIARDIASGPVSPIVDIVFLLDASGSMEDNIRMVGEHLSDMVDVFQEKQLDFTMGVVTFKYSALVFPQTTDYEKYERLLQNVKCGGDERAYDAIVKSIKRVQFRSQARRRFVLVTDEPCKGSYKIQDVLKRCREAEITVDVIGVEHPLQKYLAGQTGGSWFPIPGGAATR